MENAQDVAGCQAIHEESGLEKRQGHDEHIREQPAAPSVTSDLALCSSDSRAQGLAVSAQPGAL